MKITATYDPTTREMNLDVDIDGVSGFEVTEMLKFINESILYELDADGPNIAETVAEFLVNGIAATTAAIQRGETGDATTGEADE